MSLYHGNAESLLLAQTKPSISFFLHTSK